MNRLEESARIDDAEAGTLAAELFQLDLIMLDELRYLPFTRSCRLAAVHLLGKLQERTYAVTNYL